METLPPRQAALLDYLRSYQRECGIGAAPSVREVCAEFGLSSTNAASELLVKLEAKGAIARAPGVHRRIQILWPDPAVVAPNELRRPHRIPLLGRIAAGAPMTAGFDAAEEDVQHLDIDPGLFPTPPDGFLEVRGESMINAGINHGDLAGVTYRNEFVNRQIVCAVVIDKLTGDPERTIKRYHKAGPIITLFSENDDQENFKPLVFDTRKERVEVFGLWTSLIKRQVQ